MYICISFPPYRVLYFSLHRYDNGVYFPCEVDANYDYVGRGQGAGYNINVPWNSNSMGDTEYLLAFYHILMPVATEVGMLLWTPSESDRVPLIAIKVTLSLCWKLSLPCGVFSGDCPLEGVFVEACSFMEVSLCGGVPFLEVVPSFLWMRGGSCLSLLWRLCSYLHVSCVLV